MNKQSFKLAMIQMKVTGGDLTGNLQHALKLIDQAAASGAQVMLLPECMDLGWTHSSARHLASTIPDGQVCEMLKSAAVKHQVYVCSGLTELDGDRIYNSAVIIDPQGQVILKHRKLNELDIAHHLYAQGDRLNVVETELGTFGLIICADANARNHTLTRSLCYMGADVILSPSAWAVPRDHNHEITPYGDLWREAYLPIAKECSVAIFGVSNVGEVSDGPWTGWNCIGCSLAVDASGQEIFQGPYGKEAEAILYAEVNPVPRPARGTTWDSLPAQP